MSNKEGKKIVKVAQRGIKTEIICALEGCHNHKKDVRIADIARGMGRFCSKTCSSKSRELAKKMHVENIIYFADEESKNKCKTFPEDLIVKVGKKEEV